MPSDVTPEADTPEIRQIRTGFFVVLLVILLFWGGGHLYSSKLMAEAKAAERLRAELRALPPELVTVTTKARLKGRRGKQQPYARVDILIEGKWRFPSCYGTPGVRFEYDHNQALPPGEYSREFPVEVTYNRQVLRDTNLWVDLWDLKVPQEAQAYFRCVAYPSGATPASVSSGQRS